MKQFTIASLAVLMAAPPSLAYPDKEPISLSPLRAPSRSPHVVPRRQSSKPANSLREAAKRAYPRTHFQKAMYYRQKQDLNSALIEFLKATQENPRLVQAFYEQAVIFRERGYLKLAASSLERALAIQPGFQQARILLATLKLEQGDIGSALAELGHSLGLKAPEAKPVEPPPEQAPVEDTLSSSVIQMPHGPLPVPEEPIEQPQDRPSDNTVPGVEQPPTPASTESSDVDEILKGIPGVDPSVPETQAEPNKSSRVTIVTKEGQPRPTFKRMSEESKRKAQPKPAGWPFVLGNPLAWLKPGKAAPKTDEHRVRPVKQPKPTTKPPSKPKTQRPPVKSAESWFSKLWWAPKPARPRPELRLRQPSAVDPAKLTQDQSLPDQSISMVIHQPPPTEQDPSPGISADQRRQPPGTGVALAMPISAESAPAPPTEEKAQPPTPSPRPSQPHKAPIEVPPPAARATNRSPGSSPALPRITAWPSSQKISAGLPRPLYGIPQGLKAAPVAPPAQAGPSPLPPQVSHRPQNFHLPPTPAMVLPASLPGPLPELKPAATELQKHTVPQPASIPLQRDRLPEPWAKASTASGVSRTLPNNPPQPRLTPMPVIPLPTPLTVSVRSTKVVAALPRIESTVAPAQKLGNITPSRSALPQNPSAPLVAPAAPRAVAAPVVSPSRAVGRTFSVHPIPAALTPPALPAAVPEPIPPRSGQQKPGAPPPANLPLQRERLPEPWAVANTASGARAAVPAEQIRLPAAESPSARPAVPLKALAAVPAPAQNGPAFKTPSLPMSHLSLLSTAKTRSAKVTKPTSSGASAPADPWLTRLKYLSEKGTASLRPGEAFMFSEETGEAVLFLADGKTIRRNVAAPRDPEEVAKLRRPDILIPQEIMYNLSLLGKLLPRPEAPPSTPSAEPQGFSVSELLNQQDGFWTWLRRKFTF